MSQQEHADVGIWTQNGRNKGWRKQRASNYVICTTRQNAT